MQKQAPSSPVEASTSPLQQALVLEHSVSLTVRVPKSAAVAVQALAPKPAATTQTYRQTESALFFYRKPMGASALPEGWFAEDEID
jgi:hypothetical protein